MKEFKSTYGILRYHDFSGDEVPILWIHGLGCSGSMDYPNIASHSCLKPYRHIIVDLLGFGFSDNPEYFSYSIIDHAKSLQELVTYLKLEKLIIYGHSMGGAVAINLALMLKDKIHSLILSEANLDNGGGSYSQEIVSKSYTEFKQQGFPKLVNSSMTLNNRLWAKSVSISSPKALYFTANSLVVGQNPTWREILYNLNCSKTYIFGEYTLPDKDYEILQQKNINTPVVPLAGHPMLWENPDAIAKIIYKLLN